MSVLSKVQIKEYINREDYKKRLIITPILSEKQIGTSSVDIRLGSSIIIPQKTHVDKQDVTERSMIREVEQRLYKRVRLKYRSKFMLHPNQLILGVTFEYLSLPFDLCCLIMSRSSWGRLGLVVATASVVHPGYKGCLTLELVNLSESPVTLYPGLPVGQLVFHQTTAKGTMEEYSGRYMCSTEAETPRFFTTEVDDEMEFWGNSYSRS